MKTPIKGHYGTVTCHVTELSPLRYRLELVNNICRFGGMVDKLSFVDPSGGPMIHVEDSLRSFHRDLPDRKIVAISRDDVGLVLELDPEDGTL
jgi:hypothetical protein